MNAAEKITAARARLQADTGEADPLARLDPAEIDQLAAAAPDAPALGRWLKRRLAGESLAHVRGGFEFDGRWYTVDKRAYVTDPETLHLAHAVAAAAAELAVIRPPLVAEVGVGCGSLALTVQARVPSARLVGLDLDPDALAVAAENSRRLGLPLRLIEADGLEPWPADLPEPDFIFADPPWGDATTLYAGDRPAQHYDAMPPVSAFPLGGRTGVHAQILRHVAARGWRSEVWLNGGVLPAAEIAALATGAVTWQLIHPVAGLTLLRCRLR